MTDNEILKLLGLKKDSPVSDIIVQPIHRCLALQDKIVELEDELRKKTADYEARLMNSNLKNQSLSETLKVRDNEIDDLRKESDYEKNKHKEQLTKATKIIKILKDDLSVYSGNYQKEIAEAEQFLSNK